MGLNGGDSLARGAKSASFLPANVSQKRWDAIFGPKEEPKLKTEAPAFIKALMQEPTLNNIRMSKK